MEEEGDGSEGSHKAKGDRGPMFPTDRANQGVPWYGKCVNISYQFLFSRLSCVCVGVCA